MVAPRQSIALRLSFAFGAIIVALGVVSVACLWALVDIHGRLHTVKEDAEKARGIFRLASAVRDQYAHVAHTIIIGNDSHADLFRQAFAQVQSLAVSVRGQVRHAAAANDVDRIVGASNEIARIFEAEVLSLVKAGNVRELADIHGRILSLAFEAQNDADGLASKAEAAMEELNRHVAATQHGVIVFTITAQVVALITAILMGWYLYRSIARPIAMLSSAATRIGTGDLEVQVPIERNDELGQLARSFNDMALAIRDHHAELLRSETLAGLGRMAAGIAHELNNPVGVILGYAKLLRRRGGAVDETTLAAIETEAERCRQVIDGLLELTRGSNLRLSAVPLLPLVEEVAASLRITGTPPTVTIDVRGHAVVQGDEQKLRQLLTNLVGNAVEACGDQGHVTVAIEQSDDGMVSITISDTGIGVREEDRARIFEPFFTRKPKGTGLGLAISRAIAKAHGGDIVLDEDVEVGASFRITLPAGERQAS